MIVSSVRLSHTRLVTRLFLLISTKCGLLSFAVGNTIVLTHGHWRHWKESNLHGDLNLCRYHIRQCQIARTQCPLSCW